MLIVLSPAKALNFEAAPESAPFTLPQLADQTAELAKTTKKLRAADLKRMMSLSDSLATLNREREVGCGVPRGRGVAFQAAAPGFLRA